MTGRGKSVTALVLSRYADQHLEVNDWDKRETTFYFHRMPASDKYERGERLFKTREEERPMTCSSSSS